MNKKGFTLVELLAAITILGILMSIAIPAISYLINKNRSRIYITDAKKLVSLAEYSIRAKSSQVQIPARGNLLIFSFDYLNNGTFKNSPNNNGYKSNLSFVVVKNTADGLKYYVMLIEKIKGGGYKGIDLTSRESLIDANEKDVVKNFSLNTFSSFNSSTYATSKVGGSVQYTY